MSATISIPVALIELGSGVGMTLILVGRPTRRRLKLIASADLPPARHGWLAQDAIELGHWLRGLVYGGSAIILAAIAGAVFASAKTAHEVDISSNALASFVAYAGCAIVSGWGARVGLRLRRLGKARPALQIPDNPAVASCLLGGFACFLLSAIPLTLIMTM